MTIRNLLDNDIDAVLQVNQLNVPMVGESDLARIRALVAMAQMALVVESRADGDATGPIAGFALVFAPNAPYESVNYRWFAANYPDDYYLDRVAFRKEHQGQGLGQELYLYVQQELQRKGASALGLEVNIDPPNEASLRFHAKQGFVSVGEQRTPYGTRVSLMRKAFQ